MNPLVNWKLTLLASFLALSSLIVVNFLSAPMLEIVRAFSGGALIAAFFFAGTGRIPSGDEDGEVAFWILLVIAITLFAFSVGRIG